MAASFPTSVKSFTTKQAAGGILSEHVNSLQEEVVAIETALGVNVGAWQNYTATPTGWEAGYTRVFRYALVGKICFFEIYITGTSNNATTSLTLPFTSATISGFNWSGVCASVTDNSVLLTTSTRWAISSGAASIVFLKDMANGAFTASGGKTIRAQGFFEVA